MKNANDRRRPPFVLLPLLIVLAMPIPAFPTDWRTNETARLRLHEERLSLLRGKYGDFLSSSLYQRAEESFIKRLARTLDSPAPPTPPRGPGSHLEAYFSRPDGSPQPFWSYVPRKPAPRPGLLLHLHGYNPDLDLVTAPCFPAGLTNFAERAGAYLASPFGHGNTDFQHLGEADVLRVIDEMVARHGVDPAKVVLTGSSMGGLGAWCLAARWPDRFNAVVIDSGRADFYVWHRLRPEDIPEWQREIVSSLFARDRLPSLTNTWISAGHGYFDDIVSYDQGAYPVVRLRELGSTRVRLHSYEKGHGVFGDLFSEPDVQRLILRALRHELPKGRREKGFPSFPGQTGHRLMDALLAPFTLVAGRDPEGRGYSDALLAERAGEWARFAHGSAQAIPETELSEETARGRNLFFFGEPETSPAIRACLLRAGITYTPEAFHLAGRTMARDDHHGFLLALPSPYAPHRTAVVQCGVPWALNGADNHRFDRIPDLAHYRDVNDEFGYPIVDTAAFLTPTNTYRFTGTEPKRLPLPTFPFIDEYLYPGETGEPSLE